MSPRASIASDNWRMRGASRCACLVSPDFAARATAVTVSRQRSLRAIVAHSSLSAQCVASASAAIASAADVSAWRDGSPASNVFAARTSVSAAVM